MRGVKALSLVAKAVLVLVCLALIIPSVIHLCPFLIGAEGSYIVLGGSMQPTLRLGDLAFTVKVDPAEVEVGDVVAVRGSGVYMHRVVEKKKSGEGILLRLKGDANEDPDSSYVDGSEIIGKTTFSLPMGYLYTKSGYVLILVTPLMLLAVYQSFKLYKFYDKGKRRSLKVRKRKFSLLDTTSMLLLLIVIAGITYMMAPYFASGARSFFTDTESSRNVIGAGTWKATSTITCSVSPSNIALGQDGIISGSIDPPRSAPVTVTIRFSTDGESTRSDVATVTSNSDGSYKYEWKPEIGTYETQASWEGDGSYFGASSNIVTVSVAG